MRSGWAMLLAAGLAVAGGCGSRDPPLLQRYASATVIPGQGLDDIRLGDPVGPFLERFGSGEVSIAVGDELLAADLHFTSQGLSFRFAADAHCRTALKAGGSVVGSLMGIRDRTRFLAAFPACASMALQSVGIADQGADRGPWFSGRTVNGTALRMTRAELFAHEGVGVAAASVSSVLDSAEDDHFERFVFPGGLLVYVDRRGKQAQGDAASGWKVVKLAVIRDIGPL